LPPQTKNGLRFTP